MYSEFEIEQFDQIYIFDIFFSAKSTKSVLAVESICQ